MIERLQVAKGSPAFNNRFETVRKKQLVEVDFAKHAESMGAIAETVTGIGDLEAAFRRAKQNDRTTVIVLKTDPYTWTPGDAWWQTGVPEVNTRQAVKDALKAHVDGMARQRVGV
ncbi:MAG: thiamine pyrophosphate-dependent enzyme [Alphaproteobacteria bacterium]